ncbi:hypothetical protein BH23BAC4_BH23BAC4_03350 [soil metagenome]
MTLPIRLASIALVLLLALPVAAQPRDSALPRASPSASISQTIGITDVTVTYGRPAARDREIFGGLVPFGDVWRTGADEATTISFSTDVEIEGQSLPAGTYGLFTLPTRDNWTIIFNSVSDQWGAYQYDADSDVLRVTVRAEREVHTERLTVSFDEFDNEGGVMAIRWADVRVPIQIGVDTPANVAGAADRSVGEATDWRVPYRYAAYALRVGGPLASAAGWADRAVAIEANYFTLSTQARLRAARGDFAGAVTAGERAVAAAGSQAQPPADLDRFRDELGEWRSRS